MNDNIKTEKPKEPAFQELLSALRKETNLTYELWQSIKGYANTINKFQESKNEGEEVVKEPQTIIEQFWVEVNKLRRANEYLAQVEKHFKETIGT